MVSGGATGRFRRSRRHRDRLWRNRLAAAVSTSRSKMTPSPLPPQDYASVAVVCVECQNGVLGPESVLPALAADSADLVANLRRLLDAARRSGLRVIHAT